MPWPHEACPSQDDGDRRLNAYMAQYTTMLGDDDDLDLLMKPIETASELQARIARMSRLERLGEWFESAQYEMVIAAVLCHLLDR